MDKTLLLFLSTVAYLLEFQYLFNRQVRVLKRLKANYTESAAPFGNAFLTGGYTSEADRKK